MRASGIFIHITSLPSAYGIGSLGDADRFLKFLKKSGARFWQILPVNPTDFVNSPYSSSSTFAGNTLLIDLEKLVKINLLSEEDLVDIKCANKSDFAFAKLNKNRLLRKASTNFYKENPPEDFLDFCEQNAFWLNDFSLFCALKSYFDGVSWFEFPDKHILKHEPQSVQFYTEMLSDEVDFVKFCQYIFFQQFFELRRVLMDEGIQLIGDLPFYVALDSSDVWANQKQFLLNDDGQPTVVAGVPPDYFSADGQLWGNPIYNWKEMKADGYKFWLQRIAHAKEMFDVLRLDHFRAFDSFFTVKNGQKTARIGKWQKGVGLGFLKLLKLEFPSLQFIAEDLGQIPLSVYKLRDKAEFPGMKVLQFAFDGNKHNAFLPQNYPTNCVAYLGTHDNDTTMGWWNSLNEDVKRQVLEFLNFSTADELNWQLIEALAKSNADLVVFSLSDICADDTSSRMNTPGTTGCWTYMAKHEDFSNENAKRLFCILKESNRLPKKGELNEK